MKKGLPVGCSADAGAKVRVVFGAVCSRVVESQDNVSRVVLVVGHPEMGQSGAKVGDLTCHSWRRLVGEDEGANWSVDWQQALSFLAEDLGEFDDSHFFFSWDMCRSGRERRSSESKKVE